MKTRPFLSSLMLTMTMAWSAVVCVSAQSLPYQNPELSARERAVDLCSRLTLEEKAQLMLDESPAIPRLGIKKFFWWSEALHGAANMGNVTVFPEPVAMASSFNPELLYRCFDVASTEFRAQYNHRLYDLGGEDMKMRSLSVWTPNVNIFRDPRWGRGQETYGEDPYLTSVMGDAVVRGLQGPESSKYRKLWACAKHYAVHSGPEYTRHSANLTNVSARDMWETYMPAFKYLVEKSKVREVMCAYQRLDDDPCCGSQRLLQQILRDEWGFQYLVVSDCGAVSDFYTSHLSSSSPVTASAKAVLAGTDVECGYGYAYRSIPEAVRRGLLSEEEVDRHVVRLLEGRFDLGEMDDPSLVEWSRIPYSAMSTKESAQLSLDMARQTIVLLQNNNNVLPLRKNAEKIAVIGPNADNEPMMWGNYNGTPNKTVTILNGIRQKTKKLFYAPGCDLTYDRVMECRMATECVAPDGKKGLRGTFWNNTEMEGRPFTTEYYTKPLSVTTNGMHVFATGLPIEDFSAKYETTFTPREAGEYVLNVEGCGNFEVYVDGERKENHRIWRSTPTRTVLQAQAGQQFRIEVRFKTVKTWGAGMKINIARELPIDYQATIRQLQGINKVIFVGGISPALEGEEMPVDIEGFRGGDRTSIELPKVQRDFLRALKEAGKQVIFVCCSGSAIALLPETETCDAIVQVWYPGQEGGTAVADVLFGDVNPSGKLPVTFYKSTDQLPDYEDYSMKGRTYRYFDDALFPFGYGQSYTTFEVGQAEVTSELSENNVLTVTIPVTNTGRRDGTETVQLYIRNPQNADGPLKTLRGFARVSLKAGQTATATISLSRESFEFWDAETNTMRTRGGQYELLYGTSSASHDLKHIDVTIPSMESCLDPEQVNMPLFQTKYTADPSPLVVGDTLFLYTSHDASPEDIPDPNERSSAGFFMYDWLLWSTTDMVNWTEHGAVASLKDFPWRSRENGAWAIQTVERNGKYYLYAPLHGHGIGVLVSDSPYGPFRDPLGEPLVWQKEHWNDIDPTVFTDDDGQAYLYWGNPHTYWAKLNDDMVSLGSGITQLPHIENYQEGPWLYKRGGKYYLGFASTCCPEGLGYAMSDSPTGPWQSTGYIMRPTQRDRGNHPGIVDYKGHTYIFGQNYDLMHLDTYVHHERRSVSVAEMHYRSDGTIEEVPYWLDHKPMQQLHNLDPYRRVEAETMAWGYGLKSAKKGIENTGVVKDMPASTGCRNMYIYDINDGEYIKLRGVDFASGAATFQVTAASTGSCLLTLRLDGRDGQVIGSTTITATASADTYAVFTCGVQKVTGVHDLYLCFGNTVGDTRLDWWQFGK